jgi:hypothetical protein
VAKKIKIPKKIFGAKIPKSLRKSALIQGLIESPTGRKILADALIAAATAGAAVLAQSHSDDIAAAGGKAARRGARTTRIARDVVKSAAGAVTDVLGEAAQAAISISPGTGSKTGKASQQKPH